MQLRELLDLTSVLELWLNTATDPCTVEQECSAIQNFRECFISKPSGLTHPGYWSKDPVSTREGSLLHPDHAGNVQTSLLGWGTWRGKDPH